MRRGVLYINWSFFKPFSTLCQHTPTLAFPDTLSRRGGHQSGTVERLCTRTHFDLHGVEQSGPLGLQAPRGLAQVRVLDENHGKELRGQPRRLRCCRHSRDEKRAIERNANGHRVKPHSKRSARLYRCRPQCPIEIVQAKALAEQRRGTARWLIWERTGLAKATGLHRRRRRWFLH
mgnify:CR=1 FL=1